MELVMGASAKPSGLSQAEPSSPVSALTGFDPSRICECIDSNGDQWLPMYGCAPHECYWRKGPEFTLGQSTLIPFSSDDCFVPDIEDGEGWEAFVYPMACGVFYCPECQQDEYKAAWRKLVDRIGPPPPAIATEARRAETENTGSVHEGAGPQDIAQ
jgi:hypothetical protein